VVGSESRGISGALRRRLDLLVRIPMRGRVASLNAAVAGSVLLFAAADQRGIPEVGEAGAAQPESIEGQSETPTAESERPTPEPEPQPASDQPPKPKSTRKPRSPAAARSRTKPALEQSGAEAGDESVADETPTADDQLLPTDEVTKPSAD